MSSLDIEVTRAPSLRNVISSAAAAAEPVPAGAPEPERAAGAAEADAHGGQSAAGDAQPSNAKRAPIQGRTASGYRG